MENENALQVLIREHLTNTTDTLADIASRGGLPRQTVSGLLNRADPGGMPRRATLERLAVGLGLPTAVVIDAAADAAGKRGPDEPPDHRLIVLVGLARDLSPSQVDVLLATARALARAAAEPARLQTKTPTPV